MTPVSDDPFLDDHMAYLENEVARLRGRVAWLEQRLRETTGELVQANERTDALETALRVIIAEPDGCVSPGFKALAATAIGPERDK